MFTDSIYVDKLLNTRNNGNVKIINGVKKCGKSVLLADYVKKLSNEEVSYNKIYERNLVSSYLKRIPTAEDLEQDIREYFKSYIGTETEIYLLLDNIVNVKNWESLLASLINISNLEIIVTASHSIKTNLVLDKVLLNKYDIIEMFPFSFKEYVISNNIPYDRATSEDVYRYIKLGGFPDILLSPKERVKVNLLNLYWDSTVVMDTAIRNNIRNIEDEDMAIMYMCSTLGNPLSISNILSFMKKEGSQVTYPTITTYIKSLVDSNILYPIQRYDTINETLINAGTRYYVVDTGLACIKIGTNKFNDELLLKNIIFLEFKRRGFEVNIAKVGTNEISFLVEKDGKKEYFEVCKTLNDTKFRNKRFRALKLIKDNYPKHILSLDDQNYSEFDIKHQNIVDFLLNR